MKRINLLITIIAIFVAHRASAHFDDVVLSSSTGHICAVFENQVKCWGDNGYGETDTPHLSNPKQVASGFDHSCALDGTSVKCWGGSGTEADREEITELVNPTFLATGSNITCAIDDKGLQCVGDNYKGQMNIPKLTSPTSVVIGLAHACAMALEGVKCWGRNKHGQLDIPNLVNPVQISAGFRHTCALDDEGVKCWGSNNDGELKIPELIGPKQVSSWWDMNCALTPGDVKCWGGFGHFVNENKPKLINPISISTGRNFVCAVDDEGLKCWGAKKYFIKGIALKMQKQYKQFVFEAAGVTEDIVLGFYDFDLKLVKSIQQLSVASLKPYMVTYLQSIYKNYQVSFNFSKSLYFEKLRSFTEDLAGNSDNSELVSLMVQSIRTGHSVYDLNEKSHSAQLLQKLGIFLGPELGSAELEQMREVLPEVKAFAENILLKNSYLKSRGVLLLNIVEDLSTKRGLL